MVTKKKTELIIEFDTKEAAKQFGLWLCESGEQHYWEWMGYREEEDVANITVTQFHYHYPEDKRYPANDQRRFKGSKFLGDMRIRTTCGRLGK